MNSRGMGFDGDVGRPPTGLARLSSVYSLTLDEFQATLGGVGKDFGSMNMDELLKNIWTAEETQAMAAASLAHGGGGGGAGVDMVGGLQRQGSLTLPRTLSQKTVDEVWRDLFKESSGGFTGQIAVAAAELQPQKRQPAMGEMTLEEFLVRVGVVKEDPAVSAPRQTVNTASIADGNGSVLFGEVPDNQLKNPAPVSFSAAGFTVGGGAMVYDPAATGLVINAGTMRAPIQLGDPPPELASRGERKTGGIMGIGDPVVNGGLMPGMVGLGAAAAAAASSGDDLSSDGLGKGNGDLPSLSPAPYVFNGGLRGRRCGGGALEKVVERRQRRMIKNRESAARSRARKQAYTTELEVEVAKLKEKNQELQKKQVHILEMQKTQVMEMITKQHGTKRRCLRRTLTGPW